MTEQGFKYLEESVIRKLKKVIEKHGDEYDIKIRMGTTVDLEKIEAGQAVVAGDMEHYHFLLTKKEKTKTEDERLPNCIIAGHSKIEDGPDHFGVVENILIIECASQEQCREALKAGKVEFTIFEERT